ncbi:MAG: NnrS family protein [Verrucomicrobia bacterium]|nr:NnrS family protein [Verrucomicrobiota bacterium]
MLQNTRHWVNFTDLHQEPFRLFFPFATLAGLIGVALWPLLLLGWTDNYPGPSHARLMVQGFFGGFIFGFLGTSMPRLVEARPLSAREAFALLALFLGNVVANTVGMNTLADGIFVGEIVLWFAMLKNRCHGGMDRPPPSFVLVGLSLASALAGTTLHLAGRRWELSQPLDLFARLLSYHGFVLLCMLGAGGFLLPRFLGLGVRRNFPESAVASPEWKLAAGVAASAGALILITFALEALGWNRTAGTARAAFVVAYLCYEMPVERLRCHWRGVQWQLTAGLVCIPLGVLAAGWFSAARLPLLHLELVGGFALITTGVATRVVLGHSGAREKVEHFHPWLTTAVVLMLLGLASRVSGDFLLGIQTTHYLYGAACWLAGAVVWAVCVLSRVFRPDPEN